MIAAQAYILRATGKSPDLEDIFVSDQLTKGQVRLRILYSGLCATQMEEIFVSSRNAEHMPHMFGHEAVAIVRDIGPGVLTKKIGDICVVHWRKSSIGLDSQPGSYFSGNKQVKSGKVVTFSTDVVVPENRVSHLPPGVSHESGVLLGCALTTGWGSVVKVGQFSPGESLLVIGLGAVGVFSVLAAKQLGSRSVIGIDPKAAIISKVKQIGLDEFFPSLQRYFHGERYARHDRSTRPDLVIETSGDAGVIESLVDWLPVTSRLVLVGMPRESARPRINTQRMLDGLKLLASNGGEVDPGLDLESGSSLLMQGANGVGALKIRVLPADAIADALTNFPTHGLTRFVLKMSSI